MRPQKSIVDPVVKTHFARKSKNVLTTKQPLTATGELMAGELVLDLNLFFSVIIWLQVLLSFTI